MNKRKSTKLSNLTDSEIEQYCKGVQGVLTQIRVRCSQKESKNSKKEKHIPEEELTYS